jgi:hypothetical protein
MENRGIFPFTDSIFRQPLLASMVGPSIPAFNDSLDAPRRIDLITLNSAHKSMVTGIIPIVFCWIHSSLPIKASSKSAARAGFPSFIRNMKPEITPFISFSCNKRSTHFLIHNPNPVMAATGRKCCCSPSNSLNLPINDNVMCRGSVAPSRKYFLTPLNSILVISSPRKARS